MLLNHRLLRAHRKALGLSQTEFAELIGIAHRSYQEWEAGRAQPKIENFERCADVLGITPAELQVGYSEFLQDESILCVLKLKKDLDNTTVGSEEFYDKLHEYHQAVMKAFKVGGTSPDQIRSQKNKELQAQKTLANMDTNEFDADSIVQEFESGEHDNILDSDLPKVAGDPWADVGEQQAD